MLGEAASNAGLAAGLTLPVLKQDGQPLALICLFWLTPHLAMPQEQLALKRASRFAHWPRAPAAATGVARK